MSKRFGFTLAEVLITLGIIGVVAAMTIPTLMSNIQDKELQTKMRKEYSVLSNALQLIRSDNGGSFVDAISGCSPGQNSCFVNAFKTRLSYVKECTATGECIAPATSIKYLNGTFAPNTEGLLTYTTRGLVLKDGATILLYMDSPSCMTSTGSGTYTNGCGWVTLDVNGLKPPNTIGRDIYMFRIYSDTVRPFSFETEGFDSCTNNSGGITCASKYLIGN